MIPTNRVTTHPGRLLLYDFLEPLGLSQAEFARKIGIPVNRINEIVRGKRGVTVQTALLFSRFFKSSPEIWVRMQMMHDLTKAIQEAKRKKAAGARRKRKAA